MHGDKDYSGQGDHFFFDLDVKEHEMIPVSPLLVKSPGVAQARNSRDRIIRSALQNASSVASLMQTTEVTITELREEKGGGMPGGMGGRMYEEADTATNDQRPESAISPAFFFRQHTSALRNPIPCAPLPG
jgi:hypothetical protein